METSTDEHAAALGDCFGQTAWQYAKGRGSTLRVPPQGSATFGFVFFSLSGEVAGLDGVDAVNKPPIPENNISIIRDTLHQINVLFDGFKEARERGLPVDGTEIRTICNKMRGISTHRKSKAAQASFLKKTRRAVAGQKEFENPVDSTARLVDQVIAAFQTDEAINAHKDLCQKDAIELREAGENALEIREEAMGERDRRFRAALAQASPSVVNNATFSGANNQGMN